MASNNEQRDLKNITETQGHNSSVFDSSKKTPPMSGQFDYKTQSQTMRQLKEASVNALTWKNEADVSQQYESQSEVSSSDKYLSHDEYYKKNPITEFPDRKVIPFRTNMGHKIEGIHWKQDPELLPYLQEYNDPADLIRKERDFLVQEGLLDKVTVVGPIDPNSDCHSQTTTNGRAGRLGEGGMKKTLVQNNCKRVGRTSDYQSDLSISQQFKKDNYVIYRGNNPANMPHDGWIDSIEKDGQDIYVISKWGTGSTLRHKIDDIPSDFKTSDGMANWEVWDNPHGRLLAEWE